MSDAAQTAPIDAREASKARVQTMETVLAKVAPPEPAKEVSQEEKPAATEATDGQPRKQKASERIAEVISQRKAESERADKAEREAKELRERLDALSAQPEPVKQDAKPHRTQFTSDDEYLDALVTWKANEVVAAREAQQAQARAQAAEAAVQKTWDQRVEAAAAELEDYADVMSASQVQISPVVGNTLKRLEGGPFVAYYLASNPDEADKVNAMHPIDAVVHLKELAAKLNGTEGKPAAKTVEPSKAPAPIKPVRQTAALDQGPASTFEEYRARRKAEQKGR